MNLQKVKLQLESALSGIKLKQVRDSLLVENTEELADLAAYLKEELGFNFLSSVTAADYLQFLEVVYHFYSLEKREGPLVLRVRVSREHPKVPSLTPIFRGAEFQEREAYDLFGVIFENHPDLRRIFMWEGFAGFPLRKDYQQEDSETLEMEDVEWLEKNSIRVPDAMRKKAEELKQQGKRAIAERRTASEGP